jgi:hypothetical protein
MICLLLSQKNEKSMDKLAPSGLWTRLILTYIPSLPPKNEDAAKYCAIVGLLFREYLRHINGPQLQSGLVQVVEKALEGWEEGLKEAGHPAEIERFILLEVRMMKLSAKTVSRRG